jgi:membrane-bound lytic murein transglycosylase D
MKEKDCISSSNLSHALYLIMSICLMLLCVPRLLSAKEDTLKAEMESLRQFEEEILLNSNELYDFDDQIERQSDLLSLSFRLPTEFTALHVETLKLNLPPIPKLEGLTIPVTLNSTVRKYIEFFMGRGRITFARWYSRMGKYKELMTSILEKHDVPVELLYQCMIESGFVNDAVSSASAVGPWQFMKRTSDSYGLRYDGWVDERRDYIASTEAAARYMKDLYKRFESWSLALAAYNAGPGSVSSAIKKTNHNDIWRIIRAGHLPGAGGLYVPKIMAAMIIGQAPELYGFDHLVQADPIRFEVIEVPGGLELSTYAKYAKITTEELAELNPALRRGYTPPDKGGYALRVPIGAKARLEDAFKQLEQQKPQIFYEHQVRFGETIADLSRAYQVSARVIMRTNELINSQLEVGTILLIPNVGQPKDLLSEALLVMVDSQLEFNYTNRKLVYFPVRQSYSIEQIASFFQVTPGAVSMWNSLDSHAKIQKGMALKIYVAEDFDLNSALLARADQINVIQPTDESVNDLVQYAEKREESQIKHVFHTVKSGDTLRKIADQYRVQVSDIRAENHLSKEASIVVGMVIKIPGSATAEPQGNIAKTLVKSEVQGQKFQDPRKIQDLRKMKLPPKMQTASNKLSKTHIVKSGDTMYNIAKKYGVDAETIKRVNQLKSNSRLKIGQALKIP